MISLRPLEEGDQERLRTWRNLPDVARYMLTDHEIGADEHARWFARIRRDPEVVYRLIELDGAPVGLVYITAIDRRSRRCSWGFYLASASARGRGIGSLVLRWVLEHVFEVLDLERLWCEVLASNERVVELYRSFGFIEEGRLRRHVLKAGAPEDVLLMGILRDEWRAIRPAVEDRLAAKGRVTTASGPACTPPWPPCIVAGSRPWSRSALDLLPHDGEWHFVSDADELRAAVARTSPRFIFFLHWSWKVEAELIARHECVGFHMTDLPYGRGGSPLQNLITRGASDTVLTAFRLTDELDAGPVYLKEPLSLLGRAEDIYRRATALAAAMITRIVREQLAPQPQHGVATVFRRRRPAESELPDDLDVRGAFDFIRMLDAEGYPHAFVRHGPWRIELTHAESHGHVIEARARLRRSEEAST